jgi:hypothetical protein
MGLLIAYIFARIGSKRVIGGFTSFFLVLFLSPIGIVVVLLSRRLNDEKRNAALIEEFKSVGGVDDGKG